jgi:threonine dehydratase
MHHTPVTVAEAQRARERLAGVAIRTPLVHVETDSPAEILLKLENLQPIGSFKIRGAASKLMGLDRGDLEDGVWTASAGNMAQGVAWCARRLGVEFTAVIPDTAPEAKVAAIERLGGRVRKVPREQYFEVFSTRTFAGQTGLFVHAFSDRDVMAGNATIALEVLEDLPGVTAIYVPYGGGGLSCGIASVVRAQSAKTEVIACEPDTAAPLAASLSAGEPVVPPFTPTFIDGAGGPHVFPEMFALARELKIRPATVSVDETAAAVRFIAERAHVIAEGAGGLALAAARKDSRPGSLVCIVSGGNINAGAMSEILAGRVPSA